MESYLFKILLGGGVGSTRTDIMRGFTSGKSNSGTRNIIGVDFAVHCVELPENEGKATLQIWDFGEEDRFRSLVPGFCQGASGAILYFDLQDSNGLQKLEEWISLIREYTKNIPILICGANCDITNVISEEAIYKFVNKHSLKGNFMIDLENGCTIDDSFSHLAEIMVEQWPSIVLENTSQSTSLITNQF